MIVKDDLELFSDLDAQFRRDIRERPEHRAAIRKAIEAPPLRSEWADPSANPIYMSSKRSELNAELENGLFVVLVSDFLFKSRKLLRLYDGKNFFKVSENVLCTDIEHYSLATLLTMPPSYLQESLLSRGRARTRMFSYFTTSWRVRNHLDFQVPAELQGDKDHRDLQAILATLEGAHLCYIEDLRLHEAYSFLENSKDLVSKEMLATHLGMPSKGTAFEAIWRRVRPLGKTRGPGRPHGSKAKK